ncbi:phosphoglucosamine mutase [Candidatus Poriferisodalis sp.]|uniref:phosphoglucosamine mutase n=1 Tax=Candidatus Poriferisodalis sp. TaxID=3101277 RepID=UPI003B025A67
MELSFGTDGIRGRAFDEFDEVVAHALGRAANRALSGGIERADGARWVVGRDTRESGPALAAALTAGLRATGADVVDLGVVPTPVVAFAAELGGRAGAMVSASHNPWHDNGVKLFAVGGAKLSDAEQSAVAQCLADVGLTHGDRPSRAEVARRRDVDASLGSVNASAAGPTTDSAVDPATAATTGVAAGSPAPRGELARVLDAYEKSLGDAIEGRTLAGLHVAVDGANGASAKLAPGVLRRLGAHVTALFCEPDGRNINDGCGSLSPGALGAAVLDLDADMGLAFDGDGDRLIAVDSDGQVIDGDRQMALFAVDLAERGLLAGNAIVVTVMSNLGLHRAMAAAGIEVVATTVGDRAVLEALDAGGLSLGGEQSGHVVFRHEATTGDGLRSAVHLADLVSRWAASEAPATSDGVECDDADGGAVSDGARRTSAALAAQAMQSAPQVLVNVLAATESLDTGTQHEIDEVAATAGPDVRVLVRASGTEPVIRVMVEAPTEREAAALADRLVDMVSASPPGT